MKALIIAASILAIGATAANAKDGDWSKDKFPYAKQHHKVCQERALRLDAMEKRAKSGEKLSLADRARMKLLGLSLNRTCGGYRSAVDAADEAARKKLEDKRVADAAAAKKKADDEAAARAAEAAAAKKLEEKRVTEAAAARKKAEDEAAAARKKAKATEFARGSAAAATKKRDELVGPRTAAPSKPPKAIAERTRTRPAAHAKHRRGHGHACRAAGRVVRPPAVYVVARGDTLWAIAERHYRNGRRYLALLRANDDKIGNPDLILPCQKIYVPKLKH